MESLKIAIIIGVLFVSTLCVAQETEQRTAEKTTIAVLELEPKGVQENEASVISDWSERNFSKPANIR